VGGVPLYQEGGKSKSVNPLNRKSGGKKKIGDCLFESRCGGQRWTLSQVERAGLTLREKTKSAGLGDPCEEGRMEGGGGPSKILGAPVKKNIKKKMEDS